MRLDVALAVLASFVGLSEERALESPLPPVTPLCSSLDGPSCSVLNGRIAPAHANGFSLSSVGGGKKKNAKGSSSSSITSALAGEDIGKSLSFVEHLVEKLSETLQLDSIQVLSSSPDASRGSQAFAHKESKHGIYAKGSFKLRGRYTSTSPTQKTQKAQKKDQDGGKEESKESEESGFVHIEMKAKSWIEKPGPDWVMVGVSGTIERSQTGEIILKASLLDDTNSPLQGCTELEATATFVKKHTGEGKDINKSSWSSILDEAVFKGKYSCAGLPTLATITLRRRESHKTKDLLPPGELSGVFVFTVSEEAHTRRETKLAMADLIDFQSVRDLLDKSKRKLTEAGCECLPSWSQVVKSSTGTEEVTHFNGGVCGNPGKLRERDFCKIDPDTCEEEPAGNGWDFCVNDWRNVKSSVVKLQSFQISLEGDAAPIEISEEDMLDPDELQDMIAKLLDSESLSLFSQDLDGGALKDKEESEEASVDQESGKGEITFREYVNTRDATSPDEKNKKKKKEPETSLP